MKNLPDFSIRLIFLRTEISSESFRFRFRNSKSFRFWVSKAKSEGSFVEMEIILIIAPLKWKLKLKIFQIFNFNFHFKVLKSWILPFFTFETKNLTDFLFRKWKTEGSCAEMENEVTSGSFRFQLWKIKTFGFYLSKLKSEGFGRWK